MRHELKVWPTYFSAILAGSKTFELRIDDRGYEYGDTLILKEFDPETCAFTGRSVQRRVSYVLRNVTDVLDKFKPGWQHLEHRPVILALNDGAEGETEDGHRVREQLLSVVHDKREMDRMRDALRFGETLAKAAEWLSAHPNDVNGWGDLDRQVALFRAYAAKIEVIPNDHGDGK